MNPFDQLGALSSGELCAAVRDSGCPDVLRGGHSVASGPQAVLVALLWLLMRKNIGGIVSNNSGDVNYDGWFMRFLKDDLGVVFWETTWNHRLNFVL